MIDGSSDDDFADVVLPPEAEAVASPEQLSYAPWHRPRKQYVRREQWAHHTKGLIAKLKELHYFDNDTPLKYLTLPGPDLLDLSMVADICRDEQIKLRYTGFCFSDEMEERRLRKNVNEFTIQRQQSVSHGSKILNQKIQEVVQKRSGARAEMEKGGPFDIINLDACDPIALGDANSTGRLVDAIRSIAEYQLGNSRTPWMLFLTTPIQTDNISKESLGALHDQIVTNAKADNAFADELAKTLETGDGDLSSLLAQASENNGLSLVRIFSLGVSKWLLHMAEQAHFGLKKMNGYCYSMLKKPPYDPNMVSLGFLFIPLPIKIADKTGLTRNLPDPEAGTPGISDHIRALKKSMAMDSLDTLLLADAVLFQSLVKDTMDQLRGVGYPVDDPELGYEAWLSKEPRYDEEVDEIVLADADMAKSL